MNRIHELLSIGKSERAAIYDHDGTPYTYGKLTALVAEVSAKLADYGIRAGDRVMVISENSVTFLVAVLALSRLDAWALLVNARLTEPEVQRLSETAEIRCVVFTPEASLDARNHAGRMGTRSLGRLACGDLLLSPLRQANPEPMETGPGQVAVLIYTSGTAGEPKGVMLTHENLLFMCQNSARLRRITPEDTQLALFPGTHIAGFGSVFLPALASGSSVIAMPRFDVDKVLRHIVKDVTLLPGVPQVFSALLSRLKELGIDRVTHSLRWMSAGGAPLDLELKRQVELVFGLPLHNGYGQTEASPGIAGTRMDSPRRDASVGLAYPGVEVCIHAPNEHGVGELWARGPNVMKGYYRNPEATRAALTEDGYLRTGDLARQDADGAIHIVGRMKEMIIKSGFNVYPLEIEAVLNKHHLVAYSAVVGLKRDGDEEIVAFVKMQGQAAEAELLSWMRERLAPYKIPKRLIITDAFPQTASGKILKSKLIEIFREELDVGQ
ncbi:class I adenylate-forming enzyme family protein [Mesorhizobium sp. B4-1-4]|uniref:class I adenylate-forming enzyme family protein n=1 Tax=Mesorhizobium sp. B4-1-4 TaxID=2589888 RepID=UPI00112C765A|nr:class I adenylate-forming enzyme family protein [Mesorhizobium sp. B4-1-4]UCI31881.1 acyl--CoA ligase [Mesorhizobium sp. B4-1-4]